MTMSLESEPLLLVLYRIASLLVGLGVVYFGYRLFRRGVYEKAADIKATWGPGKLNLMGATPGAILVVFGCLIIAVALVKGVSISESVSGSLVANQKSQAEAEAGGGVRTFVALSPSQIAVLRKILQGEQLTDEERHEVQSILFRFEGTYEARGDSVRGSTG